MGCYDFWCGECPCCGDPFVDEQQKYTGERFMQIFPGDVIEVCPSGMQHCDVPEEAGEFFVDSFYTGFSCQSCDGHVCVVFEKREEDDEVILKEYRQVIHSSIGGSWWPPAYPMLTIGDLPLVDAAQKISTLTSQPGKEPFTFINRPPFSVEHQPYEAEMETGPLEVSVLLPNKRLLTFFVPEKETVGDLAERVYRLQVQERFAVQLAEPVDVSLLSGGALTMKFLDLAGHPIAQADISSSKTLWDLLEKIAQQVDFPPARLSIVLPSGTALGHKMMWKTSMAELLKADEPLKLQ